MIHYQIDDFYCFFNVSGVHLEFSPVTFFSPKQILGDFLYVDKEEILLQMSYFPALFVSCLGSTLILPDYVVSPCPYYAVLQSVLVLITLSCSQSLSLLHNFLRYLKTSDSKIEKYLCLLVALTSYRRLRIQVVYVDFCEFFFILPSYYVTYCRCFGIFLA